MGKRNFHRYTEPTLDALAQAKALGHELTLGYWSGNYGPFVILDDSSQPQGVPEQGPLHAYTSETKLRAHLETLVETELRRRAGGRPQKLDDQVLTTITLRVNAKQREEVNARGSSWVRTLIDKALAG